MPILAAFMVPHPPLIIPEVGKGNEEQVRETIDSYNQVAEEIALLQPDTIVITSPHALMYADYFHISAEREVYGSFASFGAPTVTFQEEYDTELVSRIEQIAEEENFPAGTLGDKMPELDHGTMVPLWFIRQKYDGGKIVRIGLSGFPLPDHYRLGMMIARAARETNRRIVIVASGDLSHKLQPYGPYGFAKEGPEYDKRIMEVCSAGDFEKLLEFEEPFCEKAAECGHRSFVIMAGAFDGIRIKAKAYSHQDVTGVGYGVCSFYPEGTDEGRHFLAQYEKSMKDACAKKAAESDAYVRLARAAVESWVMENRKLSISEGLFPDDQSKELLQERAGTFVSIHKLGQLRGCIGTIMATTDCIAEEIIQNAISACSRDPRFDPITEDELKYLEISVDVLGESEKIDSPDRLDVKRYGVIVSYGAKRGLLLPNLDGVDTVEEQIRIARQKGGIREEDPYTIERFEVVRHF